ncbi:CLAVATA3/ESR (CLE)-related protein 45 [Senna tora]|uniref:CLAVATA3/ESR (CLE)-related protein 45 n=1 Tax=Senna tora TaxID=362788 RepID=A0A834W1Z7_9FABA|nr:CLAVATA3/ESR (CLE)-related protein 45 [Senna tora]
MSLLSLRGLFLFVCIGILASQPYKACGLRSKDLALRWENRQLPFVRSFRMLKVKDNAAEMENLQSKMELAPVPSISFHPYQSNKRTVGKGSNPIHNRS